MWVRGRDEEPVWWWESTAKQGSAGLAVVARARLLMWPRRRRKEWVAWQGPAEGAVKLVEPTH